jgi:hypothetical protein
MADTPSVAVLLPDPGEPNTAVGRKGAPAEQAGLRPGVHLFFDQRDAVDVALRRAAAPDVDGAASHGCSPYCTSQQLPSPQLASAIKLVRSLARPPPSVAPGNSSATAHPQAGQMANQLRSARQLTAATRDCPEMAMKLPAGGHENRPAAVVRSARHV